MSKSVDNTDGTDSTDDTDDTKCQMMFANLLFHLRQKDIAKPAFTVCEIMGTEKCTGHSDLAKIRSSTMKKMNVGDPERMKRVLASPDCPAADLAFAERTVHEYSAWYITVLERSLSWKTWRERELLTSEFYRSFVAGLSVSGVIAVLGFGRKIYITSGFSVAAFRKRFEDWIRGR
jgi:hypothetical protein